MQRLNMAEFKLRVKNRLKNKPFLYKLVRFVYRALRKIRNTIFRSRINARKIMELEQSIAAVDIQINERITAVEARINERITAVEAQVKEGQSNNIRRLNESLRDNQKRIFYYHGGSGNHGCEALVKTLIDMNEFKREESLVYSYRPWEDYRFGINRYAKLIKAHTYDFSDIDNDCFAEDAIAFSIGGDNYCGYPYGTTRLALYNKKFNDKGVLTALVGCSIEPEVLEHEEVLEDLNKFSLITARESITYNALLEAGINRNTHLVPDSAFILKAKQTELPKNFVENKTIGLNVSNLVQSYDTEASLSLDNCRSLMQYIIDETDYSIALIPHVCQEEYNDDLKSLNILYNEFNDTDRVIFVPEKPCEEIKWIIGKCKILVCARTHASIAGYSQNVPTLVLGYSVKSRGIAGDIFGEIENYVLPVQSLKTKDDLKNAFIWFDEHSEAIKKRLESIMPSYIESCYKLKPLVEEIRHQKKKKFLADNEACTGCSACASVCPNACIKMVEDAEGFLRPKTDYTKCSKCDLCAEVCPANKKFIKNNNVKAYAAKNTNEETRLASSSGGVFRALAEKTISQNGVVYGAAYGNDNEVEHIAITKSADLIKLQGSKYVQSKLGNAFREIKELLQKDVPVLFSGTPCQIQGLASFLGEDYKNLVKVEIICHGVPSPLVFRKYRKELEEKHSSKITKINMRSKTEGWQNYRTRYEFADGSVLEETLHDNIYMKAFLQNLCLRETCHNCRANDFQSAGDIALADFWGIENVVEGYDDDKGVSLLMLKTKKGENLFNSVKEEFDITEVDIEKAKNYNLCITDSVKAHRNRKKFFDEIDDEYISAVIERNLEG